MKVTPHEVEAATRAFLQQMRLEHIRRYPDRFPRNVPDFDLMESTEKGILVRSIKMALMAVVKAKQNPPDTHIEA